MASTNLREQILSCKSYREMSALYKEYGLPDNASCREALIDILYETMLDPQCCDIYFFLSIVHIHYDVWHVWVTKYEDLKEAELRFFKQIAYNKRKGELEKRYSHYGAYFNQHRLDPDMGKVMDEYMQKTELAKSQGDAEVMRKMANNGLVTIVTFKPRSYDKEGNLQEEVCQEKIVNSENS